MNKYAFTLIELMVVISIIGLLSTIGYVNYRDFSKRESVLASRRQIISDLKYAQELALSGDKPVGTECSPPETLVSVNFEQIADSQYQIVTVCSGGSVVRKMVSINQAKISSFSPNPITFFPLGKGTNVSGSIILGICFDNKGAGVSISGSGEVGEKDFSCI